MNEELMLKVDNVYKMYRLGTIGGGTLTADLQSWWARVRHKEDPNSIIGSKVYGKNETFYALKGISFEVKKGEALGIIGGNGAGKSTTLKLLSQVTAPTKGNIYLNGRVASMLEVGTGFHPELTGRENIYLNGAILGMSKEEIDEKIEEIIDFSECRKFIDTPVKRYSSGMYVKLAFSVAAHLDSEIMIMDEVLAVGDMAFQRKCIDKMCSISREEGRTILYVSHNMNTIRQLCTRCIVLDHGKLIYEGDVEKSIAKYMENKVSFEQYIDFTNIERYGYLGDEKYCTLLNCTLHNDKCIVGDGEKLSFDLEWKCEQDLDDIYVRVEFQCTGEPIATSFSDFKLTGKKGEIAKHTFEIDVDKFLPNTYQTYITIYGLNSNKTSYDYDNVPGFAFEKASEKQLYATWNHRAWGKTAFDDVKLVK